MDILSFLLDNESSILIVVSVLLAMLARYFQNQNTVLYAAGQAIVDLEQEFLADIKDGVITSEEVTALAAKVEAAKAAILAVVNLFTQPVTLAQRIDILLGSSDAKIQITQMRLKIENMAAKRAQ